MLLSSLERGQLGFQILDMAFFPLSEGTLTIQLQSVLDLKERKEQPLFKHGTSEAGKTLSHVAR